MKEKIYIYHVDLGHGWLAVKRKELKDLNILHKITPYSYQKGGTVYLEEDYDATTFIKTKEERNQSITTRESYQEHSPLRSYQRFQLKLEE